ncbi:MAG TPA: pyridoxamine 5'-phosphate oxidase [Humisphaera sp.]|jgi:pyridoxamine 5'-phosphate oxidase|nr:pyridoxamine 5'-phosphate oxidase [Humisphaera sp.]
MSSSETVDASFPDISRLRVEYRRASLDEDQVDPDPIRQFVTWLNEAIAAKVNEPNAMTLATCKPDGQPSARMVLLKIVNADGFAFFTNYDSQKGHQLAQNPRAALVFFWPELERQVRIEGTISRTSEHESDEYFGARPPDARIGAVVSSQSAVIESREVLERRKRELDRQFPTGDVARPAYWGGYRLMPTRLEFWQGRPSRLHDRVEYVCEQQKWLIRRLAP